MTRAPVPAAALAALLAACTSGEVSSTAALTEPIRVESGQFIAGPLPGFRVIKIVGALFPAHSGAGAQIPRRRKSM